MKALGPYVRELESLVREYNEFRHNDEADKRVQLALDGQPYSSTRQVLRLDQIREVGAFFTSKVLSLKLAQELASELKRGATVIDPASGVGDLLLACASFLPVHKSLESTLTLWSKRLFGIDLHPEFIQMTKARLILLAINRGARSAGKLIHIPDYFYNIRPGDTLVKPESIKGAECIIVNPPYTTVPPPQHCEWMGGKVSNAAVFIESCVQQARPNSRIVALLPDVLRTGSNYLRWRDMVESYAKVEKVEVIGQFDRWADIDVFMLTLSVGDGHKKKCREWWESSSRFVLPQKRIEDHFEVRVGPVVPYRDPHKGNWFPYIHAQELPYWMKIEANFSFRRFLGTTYHPPFVVIRRTSRPGDLNRAVGTIITGTRPVAVENHLIILKPIAGSVRICYELIEKLRSPKTTEWLNERIRCRHLTVSAVRKIPWWD